MNQKQKAEKREVMLFLLPVLLLACTITKPVAQISESISIHTPTPPTTFIPVVSTAPDPRACKVTADGLNVRDNSSFSGHVIAWLHKGDVVDILPDPPVDKWIRIRTDQVTGRIHSNYCKGIRQ